MPPYLGAVAATLMIVASLGILWLTREHQHARLFMLWSLGLMISGAAWFLPSESARAFFAVTGAVLLVAAVIPMMLKTWRQASIHE